MNVMIVVTHLLGSGHLARAATLARTFQAAGDRVVLVSGGVPVAQMDLSDLNIVQLPPVRSDGVNFTTLLDQSGKTATPDLFRDRQQCLLATLQETQPDVLITELYPFGRRILRDEFLALLTAAHALQHRPVICASVRDILAPPSKPEKADAAHKIIATLYDRVLVHSDAVIMPLDLSWPVTPDLQTRLEYTGFVAPPAPALHPDAAGQDEIIVSAGGGNVGQPLFECAMGVAAAMPMRQFRLLVGGSAAAETCDALRLRAPANVTLEPARPDFRQMLNHAAASVSLCGYNTALDILQTGCPAVFVPYDAGSEVEQSIRARALAQQDGVAVVENAALSVEGLSTALTAMLGAPPRTPLTRNVDGARQTRHILSQLVEARA